LHYPAAVLRRCKIEKRIELVRYRFAMNAKPGNAAVGIDMKTEMCVTERIGDRETMLASAPKFGRRYKFRPVLLVRAGFKRAFLRKIAGEVRGIHHYAAYDSRYAQANQAPI